LHTRPDRPHATREPLQFGAEIYGHAGLEADTEVLLLALDSLRATGFEGRAIVDLADARIVRSLFAGVPVDAARIAQVHAALASKDASSLRELTRDFPSSAREGLLALVQLYGDVGVLDEAEKALNATPAVRAALSDLRQLAARLEGATVSFDLADLHGYAYYSGMRFGMYCDGASDALVRGGRYDEVGAVFGRSRPAVGSDGRKVAQAGRSWRVRLLDQEELAGASLHLGSGGSHVSPARHPPFSQLSTDLSTRRPQRFITRGYSDASLAEVRGQIR